MGNLLAAIIFMCFFNIIASSSALNTTCCANKENTNVQLSKKMLKLVTDEHIFIENMKNHMDLVKTFLLVLHSHKGKLDSVVQEIVMSRQDYLNNALNTFSLLKRFSRDWIPAVNIVTSLPGAFNPTRQIDDSWKNIFKWAEMYVTAKANVTSGVQGLSLLQRVYHLTAETLANGRLDGAVPHSVLSAEDCLLMAKYHLQLANYTVADVRRSAEWLDESVKKINVNLHEKKLIQDLLEYRYITTCLLGNGGESNKLLRRLTADHPGFRPAPSLCQEYHLIMKHGCASLPTVLHNRQLKIREERRAWAEENHDIDEADPQLLEVCNIRGQQNKTVEKELKCRYVTYNDPRLLIGPLKAEEFNIDPPVVMFHQVITDREIDELITFSKYKMIQAPVLSDKETSSNDADWDLMSRTSYNLYIKPGWCAASDRVSRRADLVTQWSPLRADSNQIASYGIAGQFVPHIDALSEARSALIPEYTDYSVIMFYLNEVLAGGHTVFPLLNLSVAPVKGSAVVWFNRRPDGSPDTSSMHAGCPVLQGTKWVVNKWYHRSTQDFPKCTKQKNSSYKYFYL